VCDNVSASARCERYGTQVDENVPIAATLKLVEALMQANKDFDYFPLANEDHSLGRRGAGPQGAWAGCVVSPHSSVR
jgi:hypothetical protein